MGILWIDLTANFKQCSKLAVNDVALKEKAGKFNGHMRLPHCQDPQLRCRQLPLKYEVSKSEWQAGLLGTSNSHFDLDSELAICVK